MRAACPARARCSLTRSAQAVALCAYEWKVAQDAGPFGVTSNAVLPGWVRTAMAERSAKATAERRGISVEQVWRERLGGRAHRLRLSKERSDRLDRGLEEPGRLAGQGEDLDGIGDAAQVMEAQ